MPDAIQRLTHGERVIDPDSGLTKLDLARYYATVGEAMLPHLQGRPVAMLRAPDGIAGEQFFQKHQGPLRIAGVRLLDPRLDPGHEPLMEIADVPALLGAVQMNAVEFHTWNATVDAIEQPDRVSFDLDPGEGVAWPRIVEAATLLRELLDMLGLRSWLKTSGGKGLHVVVPLVRSHDWDGVKGFAKAAVEHMAATFPDRFVAKSGPQNRVARIFIDYLRNGRGASTVAAFSARARPGLPVSVPLRWADLPRLERSNQWTIRNLPPPPAAGEGPWADYEAGRQELDAAMRKLAAASAV